ncbi:MAG: SpoIIE family protein phosphatase [Anaerolineae bacterium]
MLKNQTLTRLVGLGLALLSLLYLLIFWAVQLRAPSDGYSDRDGILIGEITINRVLAPQPNSLQAGDVVLAVDGAAIGDWRARAFRLGGPPPAWRAGREVNYTVRRAGQVIEVPVVLRQLTPGQILAKGATDFITGFIFLVITLFVFLKRPYDPAARLFYLAGLSISFATNLTAIIGLQASDLVNRAPFLLFKIPEMITFWLNFALMVHFFLIFPRRHRLARGRPWLVPVIYLALPLVSLMVGLVRGDSLLSVLTVIDQIRFSVAIVYLAAAVGLLLQKFLSFRTRTERNQLRWVVWGMGIGLTPWLFLFALPVALAGDPLVPFQAVNLALAAVPLAFAFSIVRYRLFDIGTIINRSLVYGLLSALLVAGYAVLVAFFSRLGELVGLSPDERLLPPTVAALLTAALFDPVRRWVQAGIDRVFYPDRLAFERLPLELSRELSTTMDLDSVVRLLTETVPERLNISQAQLLLLSPEGDRWLPGWDGQLSSGRALLEHLSEQETAIPLFRPEKRPPPLEPLARRGIEVCVPLIIEKKLVGLYNLKAKNGADFYSRRELEILTNLGDQAAISIANARSYQTVQQLNLDLEAQVEENERLFRQERHRANQLALISAVSREVTSILEVDRLLKTVTQLVRAAFDYHLVSIALLEIQNDRPCLVFRAVDGVTDERESPVGLCLPLDDGMTVTTSVARLGRPLLVPDVSREPRYRKFASIETVAAELAVPLLTQDRVIGVLDVASDQVNAFSEEDLRTMQSLAAQVATAIENARLYERLSEQERLQSELRIARAIQTSLLPQEPPRIPGLQIYGTSLPAEEVGGDFFAYFREAEGNTLGIAVGDVSGKGIPGSLFMAVSISVLRAQASYHTDTATLMHSMNQVLYPQMHTNRMNAALLYTRIDVANLNLQVSNAGLIAPLLVLRPAGRRCQFLDVSGLPLGASLEAEYDQRIVPLSPGDLILLCSDGVVEARNPGGELFGFARLQTAVEDSLAIDAHAESLAGRVLQRLHEFTAGHPPHDDMTLVVVEVEGP